MFQTGFEALANYCRRVVGANEKSRLEELPASHDSWPGLPWLLAASAVPGGAS